MGDRLKGKVAIVTGSGQGVGRGIALSLAGEGARVITNSRKPGTAGGDAASTAKEIVKMGSQAIPLFGDVSILETGEKLVQAAVDNFGRVDILVNNAGVVRDKMIFNMSPEEWDDVIKVHLYGHFNCTKPASILMRQQGSGRIINMSSTSGLGNAGQANYAAAKEGIAGFTRTVARDLGRYGVTCNAIRPGAGTRMNQSPEMVVAWQRRVARGELTAEQVAARRLPEPEYVGPFVAWLCTDAAAGINGYDFAVRGGHVAIFSQPVEWKSIDKEGFWTMDELDRIMPATLASGPVRGTPLPNPAPPQPRT
ncbi:MAG: family NAD(P)-dependent oxidoreductase [Dehalococcoidales bacterium]|nr:family NAD(P)-dependent oxidoreductase [Dehalococcoidales bacterium]